MWDSSVENIKLAMRCDSLANLPQHPLPDGFDWRYYRAGDLPRWVAIWRSAEGWTNDGIGYEKFRRYYPTDDGLDHHMIFITDQGLPVATANAWHDKTDPGLGALQWVSVAASHQGRGLARPLLSLAMGRLRELGYARAELTTQTESWLAIRLYREFGFRPKLRAPGEIEGWRIVSEKSGIDFLAEI